MSHLNLEGIVLKKTLWSESSYMLSVITPNGLFELSAKGAKRKRIGGPLPLDILNKISFPLKIIPGRQVLSLFECSLSDSFEELRRDPIKEALALLATEIFHKIAKYSTPEDASNHYSSLETWLNWLNQPRQIPPSRAKKSELSLLKKISELCGLELQTKRCISCQKPINSSTFVNLAIEDGGFICPDCGTGIAAHTRLFKALSNESFEGDFTLSLHEFLMWHIPELGQLKSRKFLLETLEMFKGET